MPRPRKLETAKPRQQGKQPAAASVLKETPVAPAHLSAGASKEWAALAPVAISLGTLRPADLRAFELLCDMLATATEAAEIMRKEGMTLSTGSGGTRAHPAASVMKEARGQAARLLAEFGLTPKGRNYVAQVQDSFIGTVEGRFFT